MQLTIKLETVVYGIFYLVLFAVLIVPLQKLIDSPTAFEEFQIINKAELPSITICPLPEGDDEIKDFIDVLIAIENAKKEHLSQIYWEKPYHKL